MGQLPPKMARERERVDESDGELESDSTSTGSDCLDGQVDSKHSAFSVSRWLCLILVPVLCVITGTILFVTRNRRPPAVLHFQFLAIDDVPHGKLWRRFFDGAPAGSFTVWLHCKERAACLGGDFLRNVPEAHLVPSVPTVYCQDLVTAQVQMLRFALELPPEGAVEKYLLLSDSTLPVKPFGEVLSVLSQIDESDFCFFAENDWSMWAEIEGGKKAHIAKHSQFVQLTRKDATTFVKRWDDTGGGLYVNSLKMRLGWPGDQPYTAEYPVWTVRVLSGSPARYLKSMVANDLARVPFCADEMAVFSSVFGAVVFDDNSEIFIDGFGPLHYDLGSSACYEYGYCSRHVQGRCYTYFSYWWWSLDDFALEADLYVENDSVVYLTSLEQVSHPVAFGNLSRKALRRLRMSRFLFARKFTADAHLPHYEEEILGPAPEEEMLEPVDAGSMCEESTFRTGRSDIPPVLHFLFLAIDTVYHAEIWEQFFAQEPRELWRVWMHCKEPAACRKSSFYLRIPGVKLVSPVNFTECSDEVSALVHMMKQALEAEVSTQLDKFVLMGDSILPVKPFREVHTALTTEGPSDFCIYPKYLWLRADVNDEHLYAFYHHRWIVLNRLDAAKLVCRWRPRFRDSWPDWEVRLYGRSRSVASRDLLSINRFGDGETPWTCTHNTAPFGLVHGAFTPEPNGSQYFPGFGSVSAKGPGALVNQGRCRTMAIWDLNSTEAVKQEVIRDPGTTLVAPSDEVPAAFLALSDAALRSIRASDYLFMVQIHAQASLTRYAELMFSA